MKRGSQTGLVFAERQGVSHKVHCATVCTFCWMPVCGVCAGLPKMFVEAACRDTLRKDVALIA